MATATCIYDPQPPPPPSGVLLKLTLEEAATLCQVLLHIGGETRGGGRRVCDNIARALREAGVTAANWPLQTGHTDAIYFALR